jgi:hypothetical protein
LFLVGRWIRALFAYDRDADPSPFVGLLRTEGAISNDAGSSLRKLAYYERTGQLDRANQEARAFLAETHAVAWPGVSGLFRERLLQRLTGVQEPLYARQRSLAYLHLKHRDYVRAAIFAREAFVTKLTEVAGLDATSHENREIVMDRYMESKDKVKEQFDAYRDIRALRNALAHAIDPSGYTESDRRAIGALRNPDEITGFLKRRMDILLPKESSERSA